MKNIIIYILILAALLFAPVNSADIGDLEPIQTVWITKMQEMVVLETDTSDRGVGETALQALADMKKNSPGLVYLDTAQFLLVSEDAQEILYQMQPLIKESARVCLWEGQGKLAEATKYVDTHKIGISLSQWAQGVKLPKLPL